MAVTRSRSRKSPSTFSDTDYDTDHEEEAQQQHQQQRQQQESDILHDMNSSTPNSSSVQRRKPNKRRKPNHDLSSSTLTTAVATTKRQKANRTRQKHQQPQQRQAKQPKQTLQQLFDASYQNKPVNWTQIHNRIRSHPQEIEAKHLTNALMIHNPAIVPSSLVRDMICYSKKNVYSHSLIQFAFKCPWIQMDTIRALFDGPRINFEKNRADGESDSRATVGDRGTASTSASQVHEGSDDEIDDAIDEENFLSEERLHIIAIAGVKTAKLHSHCSNMLHALYESSENPPPRYEAVKVMLEYIPKVLEIQDHSDNDLPLHSACWNECNAPFIELFVETSVEWDSSAIECGGLLVQNEFGISPLKLIVQKWNDEVGSHLLEKLFTISEMPKMVIARSKILHEALKENKWNIAKTIIRFSPESLAQSGSQWKLPLHTVCVIPSPSVPTMNMNRAGQIIFRGNDDEHTLNADIIQFMIEQSIMNNENAPACGGLTCRDWNGKTPLQLLSALSKRSSAPMQILERVLKFISKQKKVKNKNDHLKKIIHEAINIKDWCLVMYIIATYPKTLHLKDGRDNLPIHAICSQTDAPFDAVKLVIEVGLKQKVGKAKNKAGLFEENKQGEKAIQLLVARKCSSNGKVLKFLQEFKPKLLTKKDAKDFHLLHKVADDGRPAVARALLKSVPKAISYQDEFGNLPLHIACKHQSNVSRRDMIGLLLNSGLKEKVDGENGHGGLFVFNEANETPLQLALKCANGFNSYGYYEKMWNCISVIMDRAPDAPILQTAINLGIKAKNLDYLTRKYPKSASVLDSNKQLPIHVALANDLDQGSGLEAIIDAYPAGLDEVDPVTGLLPFAFATSRKSIYSLTFLFKLLQKNPTFFSSKQWVPKTRQLCITNFLSTDGKCGPNNNENDKSEENDSFVSHE